jgi:hypothetical protein
MGLVLVEKVLKLQISLNIWEKDMLDILDPLYLEDKIYEREVVNAKLAREENDEIMHQARNIIEMTNKWVMKPVKLDPLPNTPTLQAPT